MCNIYSPPDRGAVERVWAVNTSQAWPEVVHPRGMGPFIRQVAAGREVVVGQWALVPPWADTPTLKYSTNNARSEEVASKASFRDSWRRGQRCIIPAEHFDEPNWESGKNVWWRFRRADGEPWGLAGLWNAWTDGATGEIFESYTMLTINADDHPLMRRMHKPEPKRGPDEQDKRSVIPLELEDCALWLTGKVEHAAKLLKLAPVSVFAAGPA